VAFALTRRSWDHGDAGGGRTEAPPPTVGAWGALRRGRVWLQIGTFFVYTGVETGAGQWCFTVMREDRGVGLEEAGAWTAGYWGSLLVGRIVGGFVVARIGADRLLRICSLTAVAAALAFAAEPGLLGRVGLLLLGLSLAPFYPTLMSRTPARLGTLTAHAVGFQVSAAGLGSAAIPAAIGLFAARMGLGVVAPIVAGLAVAFLFLHERLVRTTMVGHE
jgi:fucose permease